MQDQPLPIPQGRTQSCPGEKQYYPDVDPSKFWECSDGVAHQFQCPIVNIDGEPVRLHWDVTLNQCTDPRLAVTDTM